jgi:hypothetical protein
LERLAVLFKAITIFPTQDSSVLELLKSDSPKTKGHLHPTPLELSSGRQGRFSKLDLFLAISEKVKIGFVHINILQE